MMRAWSTSSVTIRSMPWFCNQEMQDSPGGRERPPTPIMDGFPHPKTKALWSWSNLSALSLLSGCPRENGGNQRPQLLFPSPPCSVLATIQWEIISRKVSQPSRSTCGLDPHAAALGKHPRGKALESESSKSPLPSQVSEIPGVSWARDGASFWSKAIQGVGGDVM